MFVADDRNFSCLKSHQQKQAFALKIRLVTITQVNLINAQRRSSLVTWHSTSRHFDNYFILARLFRVAKEHKAFAFMPQRRKTRFHDFIFPLTYCVLYSCERTLKLETKKKSSANMKKQRFHYVKCRVLFGRFFMKITFSLKFINDFVKH